MNMDNIFIQTVLSINSCGTHIGIEFIILCRQHHLSQVFTDARHPGQIYSVVVEAKKLMNHCLICPLEGGKVQEKQSGVNYCIELLDQEKF